METNNGYQFVNEIAPLPEKPQFLKVLCILSFVACGLMILICAIGSLLLFVGEDVRSQIWEKVLQTQPQLEELGQDAFFNDFGNVCLYTLLANIVSLIGVIMMWRLNKIGFFIYAAAELAVHFFGVNISSEGSGLTGGTIFWILMDLVFIMLYAMNLKHMKKTVTAVS